MNTQEIKIQNLVKLNLDLDAKYPRKKKYTPLPERLAELKSRTNSEIDAEITANINSVYSKIASIKAAKIAKIEMAAMLNKRFFVQIPQHELSKLKIESGFTSILEIPSLLKNIKNYSFKTSSSQFEAAWGTAVYEVQENHILNFFSSDYDTSD